jgi:uncharacterized membrane protein YkoI
MKKITALLLFAIFAFGAITTRAQTRHRIGMKRALAIASKRVHGKLKSKELEKEKGKWIYSFEFITGKGKITEVNVNAYSGKVIGIEHENARKEADEEKNEKKEKH